MKSDYILYMTLGSGKVYKTRSASLPQTIWFLCERLDKLKMLDMIDKGSFVITEHIYTKKRYIKRYEITIFVPRTIFSVRKTSSGSVNTVSFKNTLNKVKEIYCERVQH